MTSNTQPVSMMVGQFPDAFVNKKACLSFISERNGDIDGTVKVFTRYEELGFKALKHDLHCIEDRGSEPV